jgi:hypothetical protein
MRISNAAFLLVAMCGLFSAVSRAQFRVDEPAAPASKSPAPAAATPAASSALPAPQLFVTSAILGPSLDTVKQTLDSLRIDKWKRGSVRDEAGADIDSIQHDMKENLPPLLKDADAAQGTLSKVLPVSTHIDALYDVLLRVLEAARISAPTDQASAIRDALSGLSHARIALDDHILQRATAQEKQVNDLHGLVEKQAALKCPALPATPACTPPPAPKKAKKKATTPAKTTSPTQQSEPAPTAKPPASSTTPPKTGP